MNISGKLTTYDFLTMLVTGFLWLFLFIGKVCLKDALSASFFLIASYLVGLIYHEIMECLFKCLRNHDKFIKKGFEKVKKEVGEGPASESSKKEYLSAYYLLAKNNCLMNIPVLEAHVAFIRDMWLILFSYIVATCCSCPTMLSVAERTFGTSYNGAFAIIMVFLLIISLRVWCKKQEKISYLIWEGSYYLRKKEE